MAWQCSSSGVISVLVTGISQKSKLRRQPLTSISLACLETLVITSTLSCTLQPRVQYLASVFHGCATTQILLYRPPARKRTGLAATNVWPSLLLSKWRRSDTHQGGACCSRGSTCLSNGLCWIKEGGYYERHSCTSQEWINYKCPDICTHSKSTLSWSSVWSELTRKRRDLFRKRGCLALQP